VAWARCGTPTTARCAAKSRSRSCRPSTARNRPIARFEREIRATSEVAHPNVVRIHDWGITDDGVWYYAMDLLDGVDLSTLVRRSGPMPAALVVQLGRGAASGLAEAHRRGVVHRDIKPGNLFVIAVDGEPSRLELLDFGIARVGGDPELTQAGALLGTPPFMAPEALAGAGGAAAADVYGLAATLYFALTGSSPRDAGGVPSSALVADVPAALDDVIVRALDAEPSRRPTAAEVERSLDLLAVDWHGSWRVSRVISVPPPIADPPSDDDAPRTVVEPIRSRPPG
jgi:serine/threonine protein kinase